MKEKKAFSVRKDTVVGIVLILIALLIIYSSMNIKLLLPPKAGMLHPGFIPILAAALIIVLSLCLIISSLRSKNSDSQAQKTEKWTLDTHELKNILFPSGCVILYYFSLPVIGFFPCTLIFLMILFKFTKALHWWKNVILSVLLTAGMYFVFSTILQVQFPSGFFMT